MCLSCGVPSGPIVSSSQDTVRYSAGRTAQPAVGSFPACIVNFGSWVSCVGRPLCVVFHPIQSCFSPRYSGRRVFSSLCRAPCSARLTLQHLKFLVSTDLPFSQKCRIRKNPQTKTNAFKSNHEALFGPSLVSRALDDGKSRAFPVFERS